MNKKYILAIDPGKEKCGLAVIDEVGNVQLLKAISLLDFTASVKDICENFQLEHILLGDGTGSKDFQQRLKEFVKVDSIEIVDEKNTTLLARELYWQINPPRSWWRLLPQSLLIVPEVIDAYAALAIAKKWLENKK